MVRLSGEAALRDKEVLGGVARRIWGSFVSSPRRVPTSWLINVMLFIRGRRRHRGSRAPFSE